MRTRAASNSSSRIPAPPTNNDPITKGSHSSRGNKKVTSEDNTDHSKGHLHSLLKAYEQTNNNQDNSGGVIETNPNSSDSISLQLDHLGRERSSTLGSIRDRGLTFGSEFDLGLGLNNDTESHDAVFDLSAVNGQKVNVVSAGNSSGSQQQHQQNQMNHGNHTHSSMPQDGQAPGGLLLKMFSQSDENKQQGHSPPTAEATSYELKHFGKRIRAGSLSTRLRSMSDLEDRGIIDSNQKGILKDLIISGDDELMVAVEKYEKGDTKPLEAMIKSGALRKRHASDIDILGDLDLDFLSMNEEYAGDDGQSHTTTKSIPIPIRTRRRSLSENSNNMFLQSHSNHDSDGHHGASYDGMGDLDFNGEYSTSQNNDVQTTNKQRADSIFDIQRNRANSLAFGELLDASNSEEVESVGKWMDRAPIMQESRKMPLKKRVSSQIVGANGGLYIINNNYTSTAINPDELEKLTPAEIKRREREAKKAMKEREKLEKKLKKERERQAKREAKEQKAMKKKKSEYTKKKKVEKVVEAVVSDDEPKVIMSGTGRPRALSDPNLSIYLDANGLLQIDNPPDWVGAYSPESRKIRIERFLAKRDHRVWVKKVKYDVRKNFADSRLRVKGRFVKKEDELLMRDLMSLT